MDSTSKRELLVSKIENGIVIDHIPSGKAFQVLRLLKVEPDAQALIAQNVESKTMGRKDLIKIEGTYLTSTQIDLIAFLAPDATLNIIQDWDVKEKRRIQLPKQVEGIFRCPNPLCPTNAPFTHLQDQLQGREGGAHRGDEAQLHILRKHKLLRPRPRAADEGRLQHRGQRPRQPGED